MARFRAAWFLAAGCLFASVVAAVVAAPAPQPRPVDKWEYAELQNSFRTGVAAKTKGGAAGGAARPPQAAVHWVTADEDIEAASWEDMATKLKAPAARKNASESSVKLRVFNRLGEDGWELAWHEGRESRSGAGADVWTFKRRVR
jgi:hypothetical protein